MAPGRTVGAKTRPDCGEAPLSDYELKRAKNMMRNNQVFQSMGFSTLASICKSTKPNRKEDVHEHSGSLYEAEHSDASEEEEVSMVTKGHAKYSGIGGRASKRVLALQQQEETTRVTRQKTAATHAAATHAADTPDAATHDATPMENEEQIHSHEFEGALSLTTPQVPRGITKGIQLDSITKGLGTKIPIHIVEGKKRPEAPMQAAKLASEGGIAIRQHIPILTHWKEYKKNDKYFENYKGKLGSQFAIDTDNKAVNDACLDMLKNGVRQERYRLKKKYFNEVPANQVRTKSPVETMTDAQWKELVDKWTTSAHKKACVSGQKNRGKVKLQQRTGSRCYIAHAYVTKQEKYKDAEPTAIDMFKHTHCSKKNGCSELVKEAIAAMEAIVAETGQEGQEPKSPIEVVSQVLPKSSTFLQNVGIKCAKARSGGTSSLRVQQLEAQLEAEKQESAGLRQELDSLKTNAQETEAKIDSLQRKQDETNALLRQLISFSHGPVNSTSNL